VREPTLREMKAGLGMAPSDRGVRLAARGNPWPLPISTFVAAPAEI
jgi:hypothetical protein